MTNLKLILRMILSLGANTTGEGARKNALFVVNFGLVGCVMTRSSIIMKWTLKRTISS